MFLSKNTLDVNGNANTQTNVQNDTASIMSRTSSVCSITDNHNVHDEHIHDELTENHNIQDGNNTT